ncbi:MAG: acyl-CoA thioesterase [Pyrobaculum sp.]
MAVDTRFEARYRVYWHHTDAAGIAHFTRILALVEQAEEDFYRQRGAATQNFINGIPRREVYVQFFSPLKVGDQVSIRLCAKDVRIRAVKYHFEIYNLTADVKAAEGHVVAVCVGLEEGKLTAVRCPEEFLKVWQETSCVK